MSEGKKPLSPLGTLFDESYAPLNRAEVLREGVARVRQAGAWAVAQALDSLTARLSPKVMRPPGAVGELEFLVACTRCNKCVEACPSNSIRVLPPSIGIAAGTPYIDPNQGRPCVACNEAPCMPSCPTGALTLLPLREVRMGTARILRDVCLAWASVSCRRCVDACPYPDEAILLDEQGRVYVDPRECIGCGLCVAACPTRPKSVVVDPLR